MTSSPQTPDSKRTACHEAGHAIVARALGNPVQYVEILENGDGVTKIPGAESKDPGPVNVESWMRLLTQRVAGYVAEGMAMGNADPGDERAWVIEKLKLPLTGVRDRWLGCDEAHAELKKLEDRARKIIARNQAVWGELATELERCKRLEGAPLDRFLSRVEVENA